MGVSYLGLQQDLWEMKTFIKGNSLTNPKFMAKCDRLTTSSFMVRQYHTLEF